MTHKSSCWSATSALALALAMPAGGAAATVLEKTIMIEVAADGTVDERTRLRVRLDDDDDLEAWAAVPIYLDANRTLASVEAHAVQPDGRRRKVGRKRRDRLQVSGQSLYASSEVELLTFPPLEIGARLEIDYRIEAAPYHPSGLLWLGGDDRVERLEVTITSHGPDLRWQLAGEPGLAVRGGPRQVRLTGSALPAADDPPDHAPRHTATHLHYAWGEAGDWAGVGRWYGALMAALPRAAPAVRAQARTLAHGLEDPRQRLEALLAFVRREVRYVAVEVGIGGYRPSPPGQVLERRWGDCKDKALLLVDLLAEAGVTAYPALIRFDAGARIDADFPSPRMFNHLIVAVPASAVATADGDPLAGGYLFLDPTQPRGSAGWLHAGVQDQHALVVRDGGGELVRTPERPDYERWRLEVELALDPGGDAGGGLRLEIGGRLASALLDMAGGEAPAALRAELDALLAEAVPGARLSDLRWRLDDGAVPSATVTARVDFDGLLRGAAERPSMRLPGIPITPPPATLGDRTLPVVLRAREVSARWRIRPADTRCRLSADHQQVDNEVGRYHQRTARDDDGYLVVERETRLARRWIEPAALPALHALARAEHRGQRRRVRLDCAPLGGGAR